MTTTTRCQTRTRGIRNVSRGTAGDPRAAPGARSREGLVQGRDLLRGARQGVLRQPTATASATSRADRTARLPPASSASTASGSCRSTPRPCRTTATTSPTSTAIHPAYGTVEDFQTFLDAAHARGLRVIADLVVNHTSDQHPWFQAARARPAIRPTATTTSGATPTSATADARIIFTDTETSNWTWDPVARPVLLAPLLQPPARPQLRQPRRAERDARRHALLARPGPRRLPRATPCPTCSSARAPTARTCRRRTPSCKELRGRHRPRVPRRRILLAEANQWPEDVRPYFGDGDEFHMAFHFPLMPRMFMAHPPRGPPADHRHLHAHAADSRRLPVVPLPAQPRRADAGDGDRRGARLHVLRVRLRPAHAAQPGHPAPAGPADGQRPPPDRAAATACCSRCPAARSSTTATRSAWATTSTSATATACARRCSGRTTATPASPRPSPAQLYLPVITDPVYSYQAVNVAAQEKRPNSLLNTMRRLIAARRRSPAFGRGTIEFLQPRNQSVLAYVRRWQDDIAPHRRQPRRRRPQPVELNLAALEGLAPVEMLGDDALPADPARAVLPHPRGPRLLLVPAGGAPAPPDPLWHRGLRDLTGWSGEALATWVARQRWFAGKTRRITGVTLEDGVSTRPGRAVDRARRPRRRPGRPLRAAAARGPRARRRASMTLASAAPC